MNLIKTDQWAKVLLLIIVAIPARLEMLYAQELSYRGGVSYSSGSYFFTENTGTFYMNNGLSLQMNRFTLSASIPYMVQNSPWISYSNMGGLPTGGTQSGEVRRAGMNGGMGGGGRRHQIALIDTTSYTQSSFSDPSVYTGFRVYTASNGKSVVMVNGQLKIPVTNPSKGFGTGAWDSALGVSVSQSIGTAWMFFGDVSHWWMGDMDDLKLNNTWAFGIGLGKMLSGGKWLINSNFNAFTSILDDYDPPVSLSVGSGYRANSNTLLNMTMSLGLSESSPDVSVGVGWSYQL